MTIQPSLPTREEFAEWVQDALNHLYDSPHLQRHPLAVLLVDEEMNHLHRSETLRRVLLDVIRAMRPKAGIPSQSPDWRTYRVLELRYMEGQSPREVMGQIALGKSQYYREQLRIVEAVSDRLWAQWQQKQAMDLDRQTESRVENVANATRERLAQSEVELLCKQAVWEEVDVGKLLEEVRHVVERLAMDRQVAISFRDVQGLHLSCVDRVLLRQAVLNVMTYGFDLAQGGRMVIGPYVGAHQKGIRLYAQRDDRRGANSASRQDGSKRRGVGLEICMQLAKAMGGTLVCSVEVGRSWQALLTWPVREPPVLLVIDDNTSFIYLFRRYLATYNWQVLGAVSGDEMRRVLSDLVPTVIILDVMMPWEDGWEVLRSLKAAPETCDIPVIVCSVLNEPDLALTLGAASYLMKPVTQQALLQSLAPWHPHVASRELSR